MEHSSKEREIPIKIIGPIINFPVDEQIKRNKNNFVDKELPPLVTYIDDLSDQEDPPEIVDRYSIEELESALFSETEEGLIFFQRERKLRYFFQTFHQT